MARGALRQAGWRLGATGVAGSLLIGSQTVLRLVDARLGGRGRISRFPVAVPVGLAVAVVLERRRLADLEGTEEEPAEPGPAAARSLAIAGGVVGGLAGGGLRRARRGGRDRPVAGPGAAGRPAAVEAGRARRVAGRC